MGSLQYNTTLEYNTRHTMGRIEDVLSPQEELTEANKLKDAGNAAFKKENLDDALECYTKAIDTVTEDTKEKAVFFKNRAAVYLKLEEYDNVVFDCNRALELQPNDAKALFRRCQASEALGKIDVAYADAKLVHNLDPKNKAIEPVLVRLHKAVQAKLADMAQTSSKVKSGAELLYKDGIIQKITRLLK